MAAFDRFERAFEHFGDAVQRETERAQTQNAAEALQVFLVVKPVTAFAAGRRDEAAFLVVFQRARRDAEAFGGIAYGQQGG